MRKIYLKQAIKGVKASPSRTLLTTLGIMIGIGTVILVLSAGAGFKSYLNYQFEIFGSNLIYVQTSVPSSTKNRANQGDSSGGAPNSSALNAVPITTLKIRDLNDIKEIPNVVNAYGESVGQEVVTYKNTSKTTYIFGSSASRFDIDRGVIAKGRGFTKQEDQSLSQVAVLGDQIATDLFGNQQAVGKFMRIGNYNFKVIGVYEHSGGIDPTNNGDEIFIPIKTLQKKIQGVDYMFFMAIQLKDNNKANITALDVADVLRRNHYIKNPAQDDFKVLTADDNAAIFDTILQAITLLLIAIAAISLIVGGVGVMNIMYVIVTERIGEVGLKKALGATNKDIMYEFLFEAVLLTLIGGILGLILGAFLSFVVSRVAESLGLVWKFTIPIWSVVISISVSMAIGIVFGVFPARNASRLDPITALNKE